MVDPEVVKEEQRAFYGEGDYSWLSRWLMPAAHDLVEAAGVRPGDRVLDVAAGDGNVASAAAGRGAVVTAVDLTPEQVDAGRARSAKEGHDVAWLVGDAEALPLPDGSFDHVLSTFGVMYAPRAAAAAKELFRVAAPGASVGVVAWPPGRFNARLYAEAARYLPVADHGAGGEGDDPLPEEWGDPVAVRHRLGAHAAHVDVSSRLLSRRAASAEALWEEAAEHVPVLVAMRRMLSEEEFRSFGTAYQRIVSECSRSEPDGIVLETRYTRAVARARGRRAG